MLVGSYRRIAAAPTSLLKGACESTTPLPLANPCGNTSAWEIVQLGPSSLFPISTPPYSDRLLAPQPTRGCHGLAVLPRP